MAHTQLLTHILIRFTTCQAASPKTKLLEIIGAGFYRPDVLHVVQPTMSEQRRDSEITDTNQRELSLASCLLDPSTDSIVSQQELKLRAC